MSVRSASVPGLRAAARGLRAEAARVGLAGWHVAQDAAEVAPQWQGHHAVAWGSRGVVLVTGARQVERALRSLATAVELYACAVEAAQQRLDALDAEADRARADAAARRRAWDAEPPGARGAVPTAAVALAGVESARRAVEEQAHADAQAFARRARAAAETAAPTVDVPFGDLVAGVEKGFGYVVRPFLNATSISQGIRQLRDAPGSFLPPRLVVPAARAGRVLTPIGRVLDVKTVVLGSGEDGLRGVADRVLAGVGLAASGVLVVAAVVSAPVWVTTLTTSAGIGAAAYGLGTLAWDLRPRPAGPVPARPRPAGPRVPHPRLVPPPSGQWPDTRPYSPFPGTSARPEVAPALGPSRPSARPGAAPVLGPVARSGVGAAPRPAPAPGAPAALDAPAGAR